MEKSGTRASRQTDPEAETTLQHHTTGIDMEPAGEKEERPAQKQLEERHRGKVEKTRNDLGRKQRGLLRAEPDGGGSLMAYAPPGAMGLSK